MDQDEFLERATHRLSAEAEGFSLTQIDDRSEAADVVRAVLGALGNRLPGQDSALLAAALPGDLGESVPAGTNGEPFGLDAFFERVAERSAVEQEPEEASYYTRAVVSLLYDADVVGDDLDLEGTLPDEYEPLFEFVHGERPWDKYQERVEARNPIEDEG